MSVGLMAACHRHSAKSAKSKCIISYTIFSIVNVKILICAFAAKSFFERQALKKKKNYQMAGLLFYLPIILYMVLLN